MRTVNAAGRQPMGLWPLHDEMLMGFCTYFFSDQYVWNMVFFSLFSSGSGSGKMNPREFAVFFKDMCSCDQVLLGFSGAPWIHDSDKWSYDVLRNVWQVFESMVWYVWCVLEFIYILSCIWITFELHYITYFWYVYVGYWVTCWCFQNCVLSLLSPSKTSKNPVKILKV